MSNSFLSVLKTDTSRRTDRNNKNYQFNPDHNPEQEFMMMGCLYSVFLMKNL